MYEESGNGMNYCNYKKRNAMSHFFTRMLILLSFAFNISVFAQNNLDIQPTINSKKLQNIKNISIRLPQDYYEKQTSHVNYPVLYFLDAGETPSREEFSNIRILTDRNIATVYFGYVYYNDNKKQNWGSESWQLVQTTKGWKIQAVSFSLNFD